MPTAYEQEIQRWRDARQRRLAAPDGWLTLVDRVVLAEGENQVAIGNITVEGGRAMFRARPGLEVRHGADVVHERELRSEEDGPPDTLTSGGRSYELYRRGDVLAVRTRDAAAPARAAFAGVDFFPIDPRWRIVARFERFDPPRHTQLAYD